MNIKSIKTAAQAASLIQGILPSAGMKEITLLGMKGVSSYFDSSGTKIVPELFFNGSICRHKEKNYFAARADQRIHGEWWTRIRIAACLLDEDYNPIAGTERFLYLRSDAGPFHVEDPRLISDGNTLYVSYTCGEKMYLSSVDDTLSECGEANKVTEISIRRVGRKRDKNFVPFVHGERIFHSYSDNPRIVIEDDCLTIHVPCQSAEWQYGHIRGGTPAIPFNSGTLISFFHSSMTFDSESSTPGQRLYFAGAYEFNNRPPFKIIRITNEPIIVAPVCYSGLERPTSSYVIFPVGIIDEGQSYAVSAGINDVTTGVFRITKHLLNKLLV